MHDNGLKISLLIPTLNGGSLWHEVLQSIATQNYPICQKIVVDSGSRDDTVKLAADFGFEVIHISKKDFNHGATRQLLADKAEDADICIFLTQDAILASPDSIRHLVEAFEDERIGLAYGRQLPHKNAKPLEIHARLFNYPDQSEVRTFSDKDKLGFKVFFCSNSFAAYRRKALLAIGGFPHNSIMGEDAIVSAKMLSEGYNVAYVASATVHHSHSYTFKQELSRYFDTRIFHEQNKWLIDKFGKPTGEGLKYVRSELKFITRYAPQSLFRSVNSIFAKWLGYSLAKYYKAMPLSIVRKLSMHKVYWESTI